jgi:endonuclease/exonuclease/phosphatase family metal-dependent hydrolase
VAGVFTYGQRDIGLGDDRADMPALTCGVERGTCVDTHSYAVACLRAAGLPAAYVGGVWFAPGESLALTGHCWCVTGAPGAPHHWDISHVLKFGLGPLRPVLNPAGGLRQALSAGRDLRFGAAVLTRFSGFASMAGQLLSTQATIVGDRPAIWARPVVAVVAGLTPVPAQVRAAWRDGAVPHVQAHDAAPALAQVEVGGQAQAAGATGSLRVVAWNVERLRRADAIARTLRDSGAQVSLLSEIDKGMARSGNSDRIADLGRGNGQAWAYGVEFIELDRGDAAERAATQGQENALGFHGNAILSGLALLRPALLRLEADGTWFGPARGQPRVGGRIALAGQVMLDGRAVTVVAVHLESHSDPLMRAAQMARLIGLIEAYDPAAPVVIGGDLNTATVDRRVTRCDDAARICEVIGWEGLFPVAAAHGFDWAGCNVAGVATQRLWPHEVPRPLGKIDWFLTRGLRASDPAVIPAVDAAGQTLSDHEAIAVPLRLG